MTEINSLTESNVDDLEDLIEQGRWVLLIALDGSTESQELRSYLDDERLQDCLENFSCYFIDHETRLGKRFGVTTPATLSIHVSDEAPYAQFQLDEPGTWFVEDILQFLDDQASEILYGDPFDAD